MTSTLTAVINLRTINFQLQNTTQWIQITYFISNYIKKQLKTSKYDKTSTEVSRYLCDLK